MNGLLCIFYTALAEIALRLATRRSASAERWNDRAKRWSAKAKGQPA